ncbi:HTTM domain-containing protein [Haliscomenobacter hydrossis]|uniref:HTTM domain protein n=1 Tax=Haliscomenobacter hydrossis (strain ATCC 27775 / DSM 1100 / LMG 10767 / O) TaxID=760192 RepID=F4L3F1_HALH1|nr:HTTM domain-containing protein [Haliscomenobacter hydrossis]AEE52928.1 HTTM domain protein [Haliscomenobacter hydrossis DSM 1100]
MRIKNIFQQVDQFFFAPSSGKVLAFFRIAIATFCLVKFWSIYKDLLNIFGSQGFVKGDVTAILLADYMPRLTWLSEAVTTWGVNEVEAIYALFFFFILVLILLGIGFQTRLMSILALFVHLMFFNSGKMFMYGMDYFSTSALFYAVIMPLGKFYSLDNYLRSRAQNPGTVPIFFMRVLQLHLCLVYFFGGFPKSLGLHWWNGEAIWRAVSIPGFYQLDMNWLASVPWLSVVLGWSVLVVELGYPIFIWFRKTRPVFLLLVCCMHLGIGVVMGLHYFAALMILLNVTAFGWPYVEKKGIWWHQPVLV